jgi:hypothetical protein
MQIITHNPYRILGILANASAREKERQLRQMKQYLEAEQQPPQNDYSFPALGTINRTLKNVTDAASKLNLDSDKMNAALFWFWKGNEITDEPAFDALKEGDINTARQIWEKLIIEPKEDEKKQWKEVTDRNYSAFHNCFILQFLNKTNWALMANLIFLESDYWVELKKQATDETFKTTKKELQLNFLNIIADGIEKRNIEFSLKDLIDIIKDENFSAKPDFLKIIAQKFTKAITEQIESACKQRRTNKSDAAKAAENLYNQTKDDLERLKSVLDVGSLSYSNIADKVANEILQCSIDFFNDSQEKELNNNYHERSEKLAKLAQGVAVGNMIKERIKDELQTLERMKNKEIVQAIDVWKMIKKAYDDIKFNRGLQINIHKVNNILDEVLTPDTIKKIELCSNYSLLNEYIDILDFMIGRPLYDTDLFILRRSDWIVHRYKIIGIRNKIGKQELFEELSLKIQLYSTDKFKDIRRVIDILKLLENYSEIKKTIIREEITDNVLISISQCGNSSLINDFYEQVAKNNDLRERTEKIFIEKLPDNSTLKQKIISQIEECRIQEEERKEKERIASLWYNKPKKWNEFYLIIIIVWIICTIVGIIGGGIWTSIEKGHFITGAIIGALISVVLGLFIGFIVNYFIYIIYRFIAFIVRKKSRKD